MYDEVKEFKNYLRNYPKQIKRIERLKTKRGQIYYNLSGMSAKPVESNGGVTDPTVKEQKRLEQYEKIERINEEIRTLEAMTQYTEAYLERMDKTIREICIAVYCKEQRYESLESKYGYTASGLARQVNKEIIRLLREK